MVLPEHPTVSLDGLQAELRELEGQVQVLKERIEIEWLRVRWKAFILELRYFSSEVSAAQLSQVVPDAAIQSMLTFLHELEAAEQLEQGRTEDGAGRGNDPR